MTCGLYIGVGDSPDLPVSGGTEIPYLSSLVSIHVVDLLAEVAITYKFINKGDLPIRPTFIFPLNNVGVLCDVEVNVGTDKKIGPDVDLEVLKQILDHKETRGNTEFHVIKPGEVPPNTEVSIKCTFITMTTIANDYIQFTLPSYLLPPKPIEQPDTTLRALISMDMHDKVHGVASQSHPDSVSFTQFVGGKASADVVMGTGIPTDLSVQINVINTRAPRVWTSVGKSGSLQSRMSLLVLCPPFKEPEGTAKSGEVILLLDLREDIANIEPILIASLKKIPTWAHFNVLASFDGSSFSSVFDSSVSASDDHFNSAVVKIKSAVAFSGEDAAVLPVLQSLLTSSTSFYPRVFFFVTSMGAQLNDALKIIAANSTTTRSTVVSLKTKWNEYYLPDLFTLNGGSLLQSSFQDLVSLLPTLIEQKAQKSQFLTFSPTPRPSQQFPLATPPLFHNSFYLTFMLHFEQLTSLGEIEVKGGDNWNDSDTLSLRAKEVNTQSFHRLGSYLMLSELKAGLRQESSPSQKEFLQTMFFNPFTFQPITPKNSSSNSISGFIGMLKSGAPRGGLMGGKTLPAGPPKLGLTKTGTDGGGSNRREIAIKKHVTLREQMEQCPADNLERLTVTLPELEAQALHIGSSYIRNTIAPLKNLSLADTTSLRSILLPIIQDPTPAFIDAAGAVNINILKPLIEKALQEQWKAQDEAAWFEVSVTEEKGSRPYMEDQSCIVEAAQALLGLPSQPRMAFFGIFDGHLGRCAAEFTKANLPYNIFRHASFDANTLLAGDATQVKEAIKGGYLKTDSDFMAIAEKEGYKSGTTAVTLLLLDDYIVVSNVGDSEAVVCRDGKAVQLSILHTPLNEDEKKRVAAAGGTIVFYGQYRVNGVLAVTRSIGDRMLKDHVTALPDTVVEKMTPQDEFIIMGSDGLWDVIKYQEAVDFVKTERAKILAGAENASAGNADAMDTSAENASAGDADAARSISRRLVDEALRKDSKDNISALVVFFKH